MDSALANLRRSVLEVGSGIESREWAASTFDEKMICVLPAVANKKHFKKLSHEATMDKLDQISRHFRLLNSLRTRVRSRSITSQAIMGLFDQLLVEKPCALVRIAIESSMMVATESDTLLFGEESCSAFFKREITQVHPFIKPYSED